MPLSDVTFADELGRGRPAAPPATAPRTESRKRAAALPGRAAG